MSFYPRLQVDHFSSSAGLEVDHFFPGDGGSVFFWRVDHIFLDDRTNFKVSGQSVATWCRDNNIKPHRLSYRLQKENATTTATNTRWLSLNLDEPEIASITVKIGPALIEINHGFDPELLLVVVRTLKSI